MILYLGPQMCEDPPFRPSELRVDQAHRGFTQATDDGGFASLNPLYMRYVPSPTGHFQGQTGYGYISIAR